MSCLGSKECLCCFFIVLRHTVNVFYQFKKSFKTLVYEANPWNGNCSLLSEIFIQCTQWGLRG